MRISAIAAAILLLAAIAYCVLGPHSLMSRIWWIPDWVGQWADRHPYFRNFPPFAAFSALLFVAWNSFSLPPDDCKLPTSAIRIFQRALVCALLVSVLGTGVEFLQQLIPERVGHFRYMQILWSVVGAFFGSFAVASVSMLLAPLRAVVFTSRKARSKLSAC